jgi:serine/threonine protein kinase
MTDVDDALMDEARTALEVTHVREFRSGAQKRVELVSRKGEDLVLKVIAIGSSTPDALQRAEREVNLLASLASDHVVRVRSDLIELGEPPRGAAWLEEALTGQDLSSSLFSGEWSWDEARDLGIQVARGLGAAHKAKVVHRDLSANNVRRLDDGTYRVMDFGFARHTLRSGLTIAGQPGTRGYASPEHLNSYSGAPTAASDVFAVGILMYAGLTQALPIPYSGDDADYARRLMRVEVTDVRTLRIDITEEQAAVIRRSLHPHPARRYLNGHALADALEATP